jgi:hypothetical protein
LCWILEVAGSPFPVDIEESKTVGHLKELIVNKKLHLPVSIPMH